MKFQITLNEFNEDFLQFLCEKIGIKELPTSKYGKINEINACATDLDFGQLDLNFKKIEYVIDTSIKQEYKIDKLITVNKQLSSQTDLLLADNEKFFTDLNKSIEENIKLKEQINQLNQKIKKSNEENENLVNDKKDLQAKIEMIEVIWKPLKYKYKVLEKENEHLKLNGKKEKLNYDKFNRGYFVPYDEAIKDHLPKQGEKWKTFDSIPVLYGGLYKNNGWVFSYSAKPYLEERFGKIVDPILSKLYFKEGYVYSFDKALYEYIPLLKLSNNESVFYGDYCDEKEGWNFTNVNKEIVTDILHPHIKI
jgi:hypothetical protein